MTKVKIAKIIKDKTDIDHALNWRDDSEKLLNFDYNFNDYHLGLSCTDDADQFDYALDLFERRCVILLTQHGECAEN